MQASDGSEPPQRIKRDGSEPPQRIKRDGSEPPQRIKLITTRVVTEDMLDCDNSKVKEVLNSNNDQTIVHLVKISNDADPTRLTDKPQDGLLLRCFDGSLLAILEIQPTGKRVMDVKSFVNGLRGQQLWWKSRGIKSKKFSF